MCLHVFNEIPRECNVHVAAKEIQVEDLSVQLALLVQPQALEHVKQEPGDDDDGPKAHENHANTNTEPKQSVLAPKKVLTRRDSHHNS